MKPRVLLVINHPTRDGPAVEKIGERLKQFTDVKILEWRDPNFFERSLCFAPDAIFTFPFTARTVSRPFIALKALLDCRIICYRTEGGMMDDAARLDHTFVGYDLYPPETVDLELFWGDKAARIVGEALLHKGRITSRERCKVAGNVDYEHYFDGNVPKPRASIKTLLFLTGFQAGDYTLQDILGAHDWFDETAPDLQSQVDKACLAAEKARAHRGEWIKAINATAIKNPELSIIVKPHPIELIMFGRKGVDRYKDQLRAGIRYETKSTLPQLLAEADLVIHYGSTALAESILCRIPSIYAFSSSLYPERLESDFIRLSTCGMELQTLPDSLALMKSHLQFISSERQIKMLSDVFNILPYQFEIMKGYELIRQVVYRIVTAITEPVQRFKQGDPMVDEILTEYMPRVYSLKDRLQANT